MANQAKDLISRFSRQNPLDFSDWKDIRLDITQEAGAYAVWREKKLLFVGFAGTGKKHRGLRERLAQHTFGKRNGDNLSLLIFDRFILPLLTREQIRKAAAGRLLLDDLTAKFVLKNLSFTWMKINIKSAMLLEKSIREGLWRGHRPLLNPLPADGHAQRHRLDRRTAQEIVKYRNLKSA